MYEVEISPRYLKREFEARLVMICPECEGDTFVPLFMLRDNQRLCETCGEIVPVAGKNLSVVKEPEEGDA